MSHEKDRDHQVPAAQPPREPDPLTSRKTPDRKHPEHPTVVPREPVDPKIHPSRRVIAERLRPA
jgi:hypothetical protein